MAEGDAAGEYLDGCGKLHRISGILSDFVSDSKGGMEKAAGGCFGWCRVDSIYCGGDSLVQVGQKLSSMEIYNGGLECGMDGFLSKPIDIEELINTLQKNLD